jgi:hypothetical protein
MLGINKLHFNETTIRKMVQHYFDTVLFARGEVPEVRNVQYAAEPNESVFVVVTAEKPKDED